MKTDSDSRPAGQPGLDAATRPGGPDDATLAPDPQWPAELTGTAFAVRTEHASLRSVGLFTNRFLLGGIAFSLAFAGALVYVPALHDFFGTAALSPGQLATVALFPFIVWGADELRRLVVRHRSRDERTDGAIAEPVT
jgi:hypothetical protein